MKKSHLICLVVLLGLGLMLIRSIPLIKAWASIAEVTPKGMTREGAGVGDRITVHAAGRGNPWINLRDGVDLPAAYTGAAGLEQALEQNLARPLSLVSADFDEDGVPDLVSGYVGSSSGILSLHRGNVDSIYPNSPEAQKRKAEGTFTDLPFLSPARVFEVPEAPEFLGTGDFDADGHWDAVTAAHGSDSLYLLPGDGRGGLGPAKQIELPGTVTALVTGEINRRDGLDDVVVGIVGANGPEVLVFEGPEGALRREPEAFALPGEATTLALGHLDNDYMVDLAAAAGSELLIVHGRDRRLSLDEIRQAEMPPATISQRSFPFTITSLALGDLIWDQDHRTDIALLSEDGTVHYLRRGDEVTATWQEISTVTVSSSPIHRVTGSSLLVRTHVSSLPTDDLVVTDPANHQLHILMDETGKRQNDETVTALASPPLPFSVSLETEGEPVAVLPMRLNADALSDLVILKGGPSSLTVAVTASSSTFTVNSTGNGSDCDTTDGICSTGSINPETGKCILTGICTLRAAIQQANASPGVDAIVFGVSAISPGSTLPTITGPVTIDGTTAGRVELSGSGLIISAGSSTVRGLVINRASGDGIELQTNGGNVIEGNYIGTDVTGNADLGNAVRGVDIFNASSNTIGGTTPGARNLISGNNSHGVSISGSGATGNLVQGNFIGTDVTGTTDLGNAIDGVIISSGASSNTIGGTTTTARNVISGNNFHGVDIQPGATGTLVQGNFIGTDVTGTASLGNTFYGVPIVGASSNTIGGTTSGARNVISGSSSQSGVIIAGVGATGNQVQGNFIGTDVTGTADLGNALYGVAISDAPGNTIGGTTVGARNIISGNDRDGVFLIGSSATGNVVQGNFIGTNVTGTVVLGNTGTGVLIAASNNTIGGTTPGARNVISGNGTDGVLICCIGQTGNQVQGNFIGTDVTGTADLGNSFYGVVIGDSSNNNTIGGTTPGARNIISGNDSHGVFLVNGSTGNLVQGNFIGTDVTGTADLGNAGYGVGVGDAPGNTIGGTASGAGNTIAFNSGAGVSVFSALVPTNANAILSNSIFSNAGLGIDLGADGVTPNDEGDGDTGANNLQNFPVIISASSSGGSTTIGGTLNSTPNTTFTLEFFSNTAEGEGENFIGSTTVTTDDSGNASFTATFSTTVPSDQFITATATDPNNNTSEFSTTCSGSDHTAKQPRPICLGVSGGNITDIASKCCGGTLGALVTDGSSFFILSNNHVLAKSNYAAIGDDIVQPGLIDANCKQTPGDVVADLTDFEPISFSTDNSIDAAIAEILAGQVDTSGSILEIGQPSSTPATPAIGMPVKKSGRTTGLTYGTIAAINVTIKVRYPKGGRCGSLLTQTATFTNQIRIVGTAGSFSAGGDSGSLIVEDMASCPRPEGLLFAGSKTDTFANPIEDVLDAFGVTVVGCQ